MVIQGRPVDLHTHTRCSDGELSPTDLIKKAAETGLVALAVTDHDTTEGIKEAQDAGKQWGIEVIPGVEISARSEKGMLHILGYFLDIHQESLQAGLREYLESRNRRNPLILKRLLQLGYPLDMAEVTILSGGKIINRPHIAQAMVNRGYTSTRKEAFDLFLGQGGLAYVPKEIFSLAEAVELIHQAGGLAVIAHPALLQAGTLMKTGNLLRRLHRETSFDGIEAYHGDCIREHSEYYASIAKELGLFITGGSDFHGDERHQGLGQTRCLTVIPYDFVESMKQAHHKFLQSRIQRSTKDRSPSNP